MAYGKVKISCKFADDADYTENVLSSSFDEMTSSPTKHLFGQKEVTVAASPVTLLAVNNFATIQRLCISNVGSTYTVRINWTTIAGSAAGLCTIGPGETAVINDIAAGAAVSATAISGTTTVETFVLAT